MIIKPIHIIALLFFSFSLFSQTVTSISGSFPSLVSSAVNKHFSEMNRKINPVSLLRCPQYKQAVQEIQLKKTQFKSAQYKSVKIQRNKIGDIKKFYTCNIFDQTKWNTIYAKLIYDTTSFAVWIDTTDNSSILDSTDRSAIVDSFEKYILYETSAYSVNSSMGILEIMKQYFVSIR